MAFRKMVVDIRELEIEGLKKIAIGRSLERAIGNSSMFWALALALLVAHYSGLATIDTAAAAINALANQNLSSPAPTPLDSDEKQEDIQPNEDQVLQHVVTAGTMLHLQTNSPTKNNHDKDNLDDNGREIKSNNYPIEFDLSTVKDSKISLHAWPTSHMRTTSNTLLSRPCQIPKRRIQSQASTLSLISS